ncbi:MAG: hypothetical protein F6K58_18225 [Symploca sp. SIO2E9]|nr:hypothetical protein [Symploca sp. SIO2E9]
MLPKNQQALKEKHSPWLQQLENLALNALETDNWPDVFDCIYEKMEQLDLFTIELEQQQLHEGVNQPLPPSAFAQLLEEGLGAEA